MSLTRYNNIQKRWLNTDDTKRKFICGKQVDLYGKIVFWVIAGLAGMLTSTAGCIFISKEIHSREVVYRRRVRNNEDQPVPPPQASNDIDQSEL